MLASPVIETDALVIGAGPVGLWTVFELGLLGVHAQVLDALDFPGGQCAELYPDKPLYDIPGLPRCTGRELTQILLKQIEPFACGFHLGQLVSRLERQPDGRLLLTSNHERQFLTRTLFIAAGVGAFVPRELKLDGLAGFLGQQLFYHHAPAQACAGKDVLVVGGDDAAVDSALALASAGPDQAKSITLLHRRDVLQAAPDALAHFASLRDAGHIRFVAGQPTGLQLDGTRLIGLVISTPANELLTLHLDTMLVCLGVSPKLGPISQWGLAMEKKQVLVNTENFATSEPGIFAVGDINTYPGKKKLIVCGFHEATLAAFAAAALVYPQQSSVLQYTTSSALLQQRLGVLPGQ